MVSDAWLACEDIDEVFLRIELMDLDGLPFYPFQNIPYKGALPTTCVSPRRFVIISWTGDPRVNAFYLLLMHQHIVLCNRIAFASMQRSLVEN